MPIKLNFKRTHRYNVSAKDLYVIRIFTLDGTCVEYTVSSTTTGRDALEYVAQRLDIEDICFFGFKYEDWSGECRWLFLNKSVKKQLDKHARQHALTLTVMLFIDNPQFICDSQLRRFFYLQLKQDVATGLLPVTLKLGIKLSAYSLQADFGDFVDVETTLSNWRERSSLNDGVLCGAFDLSTTEYVDDILWGYLHLQGVSQDNAVWYFLDEIRHVPRYGVRTFRGMTCRNEPAELGVSRNGITITTLEPQQRTTVNLKWEHIKDLTYSRKTFTIQLLKKTKSVHFLFEDNENARYLWQFCIQMHSSYIEYWTRVKSAPQQPAIHVSEPPDILRGTELRYANPESPVINEPTLNRSSSSLAPAVVTPSSTDAAAGQLVPLTSGFHSSQQLVVRQNIARPSSTQGLNSDFHNNQTPSDGDTFNQPRSFKIDPALAHLSTSAPTEDVGSSAVQSPEQLDPASIAFLTAIQEGGVGDSESGTLVGRWSLRSGADTIDSQMINQGCVACIPGKECLRPTGWFQPRAGVSNLDSGTRVTKPAESRQNGIRGDKTAGADEGLVERQHLGHSHHRGHHRRHHHQQQDQEKRAEPGERSHRGHQLKRQRQSGTADNRKMVPSTLPRTATTNQSAVLAISPVDVLITAGPSSPSSLASSDSSSEHGIVSSRASFSSSSSSCSEPVKKPSVPCDSGDESCSSSSSTSSMNSAGPNEYNGTEASKKSSFTFTTALCSAAHNTSFKPGGKQATRANSTGSTMGSGRKLWHEIIQSNAGGLRPLLSGFGQRHYRPQAQLKRQQAAVADALSQEHNVEPTAGLGSRGPCSTGADRQQQGQTKTRSPGGHRPQPLNNRKTLHEFQQWLTTAKQRLPVVWTSTMSGGRGMTLQISTPIRHTEASGQIASDLEVKQNELLPSTANVCPMGVSESSRLSINHESSEEVSRLARSSSEACARKLAESAVPENYKLGAPHSSQQQSPSCNSDSNAVSFVADGKLQSGGSAAGPPGSGPTPSIHLHPPSPTQKSHNCDSLCTGCDGVRQKDMWSYDENKNSDGGYRKKSDRSPGMNSHIASSASRTAQTKSYTTCSKTGRNANFDLIPDQQPQSVKNDGSEKLEDTFSANVIRSGPLQRQGAFRVSPSWRLMPCPLTSVEAHRLAITPPRNPARSCGNETVHVGSDLTKGIPGSTSTQRANHRIATGAFNLTTQPAGAQSVASRMANREGLSKIFEEAYDASKDNGNGHYSAPPSTPSGRLHFVWIDGNVSSDGTALVSQETEEHGRFEQENGEALCQIRTRDDQTQAQKRTPEVVTRVNLSNYLANPSSVPTPDVAFLSRYSSSTHNYTPPRPGSSQGHSTADQGSDQSRQSFENNPTVSSALTTSSSSEQSSTQRPPSGPLHLLTNSDIHQLLSLTNIKETELAHRLLAEYRQALLQQQSLHTNSVSTPNLTASQELQMFSSSTAAEDIEEVELEPEVKPESPKTKKPKEKKVKQSDSTALEKPRIRRKNRIPADPSNQCANSASSHRRGVKQKQNGPGGRNQSTNPSSLDSPDYVNAAAFCGESGGCAERPLSMTSSTDMESNGTFRILSSGDTRTSSVGGYSMGNLVGTCTGESGSIDDTSSPALDMMNNQKLKNLCSGRSVEQLSRSRVSTTNESVNREDVAQNGTNSVWNGSSLPPDLCLHLTKDDRADQTVENPGSDKLGEGVSLVENSSTTTATKSKHHLTGEYENLENLSNEKLQMIQAFRIPNAYSSPLNRTYQQTTGLQELPHALARSDSADGTLSSTHRNQYGSVSTLAYSTVSVPASPSSYSCSASTLSSSSTSSSELNYSTNAPSQRDTNLKSFYSPQNRLLKTRPQTQRMDHLGDHNYYPEIKDDGKSRSVLHCSKELCSKKGRNPNTNANSAGTSGVTSFAINKKHCECYCHYASTGGGAVTRNKLIKSSSLRMRGPDHSQLAALLSPCDSGLRFGRQKARSFDPFSVVSPRGSHDQRGLSQIHVSNDKYRISPLRSAQLHRRPKSQGKCLPVWRPRRQKTHLRRRSPFYKHPDYSSQSDEDKVTDLCYLSDREQYQNESNTSATLSPAESPPLSSASSYSFSASSLDVQGEEVCQRYGHWYAPSFQLMSAKALKEDRGRRGGSLDPEVAVQHQRIVNGKVQRRKITRQVPPAHQRPSHRRHASKQPDMAFRSGNKNSVDYSHFCDDSKECCSCSAFGFTAPYGANLVRQRHFSPDEYNLRLGGQPKRALTLMNCTTHTPVLFPHHVHHHHRRHRHVAIHRSSKNKTNGAGDGSGKPPVARRTSNELRDSGVCRTSIQSTTGTEDQQSEQTTNGSLSQSSASIQSVAPAKPQRPSDLTLLPRRFGAQFRSSLKTNTPPTNKPAATLDDRQVESGVTFEFHHNKTNTMPFNNSGKHEESGAQRKFSGPWPVGQKSLQPSPDLLRQTPSPNKLIMQDVNQAKSRAMNPDTTHASNRIQPNDTVVSHLYTTGGSHQKFSSPSADDVRVQSTNIPGYMTSSSSTGFRPENLTSYGKQQQKQQEQQNTKLGSPSTPTLICTASMVLNQLQTNLDPISSAENAKHTAFVGTTTVKKKALNFSSGERMTSQLLRGGSVEPSDLTRRTVASYPTKSGAEIGSPGLVDENHSHPRPHSGMLARSPVNRPSKLAMPHSLLGSPSAKKNFSSLSSISRGVSAKSGTGDALNTTSYGTSGLYTVFTKPRYAP